MHKFITSIIGACVLALAVNAAPYYEGSITVTQGVAVTNTFIASQASSMLDRIVLSGGAAGCTSTVSVATADIGAYSDVLTSETLTDADTYSGQPRTYEVSYAIISVVTSNVPLEVSNTYSNAVPYSYRKLRVIFTGSASSVASTTYQYGIFAQ